jgi:hypothetical protein
LRPLFDDGFITKPGEQHWQQQQNLAAALKCDISAITTQEAHSAEVSHTLLSAHTTVTTKSKKNWCVASHPACAAGKLYGRAMPGNATAIISKQQRAV